MTSKKKDTKDAVDVRYIKRVVYPNHLSGNVGETRELPIRAALRLEKSGYVEMVGGDSKITTKRKRSFVSNTKPAVQKAE